MEQRKVEIVENCDYFFEDKGSSGKGTSVSLDYFGYEHCLPRHSYGPNIRTDYVIHVVIDGKGILDWDGRRWTIHKWYYCWIGFHGDSASKIVESIGFSKESPVLTYSDVFLVEKRIKRMLEVRALTLDGQLCRNAEMMQILSDMILERSERIGNDSSMNIFSYSEYAVRYINNHFSEKVRIQDLAKKIGISRSYLVKLMKQETGMSPQEYLIETRMRRAADLLSRSNDSIRTIAAECGYEDALAFSKVFKSRYGCNPSDFRAQTNSSWNGQD